MKYIYRIQDQDWRGPFKPGFTTQWVRLEIDQERLNKLKPWPLEFSIDVNKYTNLINGCHTTGQLREWFNKEEVSRLLKFGYKVYKVKVDEIVALSDIQCVANIQSKNKKRLQEINLYQFNEAEEKIE